jgi:hypothetical protein
MFVVLSRYRGLHRTGVGGYLADHTLYEASLLFSPGLLVEPSQAGLFLVQLAGERGKPLDGSLLQSPSNSSSFDAIDHSSERLSGTLPLLMPGRGKSSSESTPKANASLRNVPKWGREILPLSIPETVVGLIPASSASRTWVHIRHSRNAARFLPA